jgi:phosphoribosylglycinamide formyltransferase-1
LARARQHGIATAHLSRATAEDPAALDQAVADRLAAVEPDLVVLAGFMKKLGPATLARFEGRVINTHPSLLPDFGGQGMYGGRVHAAVLAAGRHETGISVHLVDGDYDTGRVLAQQRVPVRTGDNADTLAARLQSVERPFLVQVLGKIANGEIRLDVRV